jgi:hypothetical protein
LVSLDPASARAAEKAVAVMLILLGIGLAITRVIG